VQTTCWIETLGLDIRQRFYNAAGIRTRCIESGEGPPLIMIHGTGGHAEAFMRNFRELGRHFRVFAVDMVGHGYTDKPGHDYTLPVYAEHLTAFMDAAGIRRAHLHGESLGGWIAAWTALHYPERVDRLVLNTAGGFRSDPETMKKVRDSTLEAVRNVSLESVRKRLAWLFYDPSQVTDELVEVRRLIYSQPEMLRAMEHVLCLQDMAIREPYILVPERLAKIRHKTLVLWTSNDPTAPIDVGREAQRHIPDSTFVVMNECGHWPQWENPPEFDRINIKFFAG